MESCTVRAVELVLLFSFLVIKKRNNNNIIIILKILQHLCFYILILRVQACFLTWPEGGIICAFRQTGKC